MPRKSIHGRSPRETALPGVQRARPQVVSKSLANNTELTLMMPVRPGFIPTRDTVTYATRARIVMQAFHGFRQVSREASSLHPFSDVVERISTIQSYRLALLENDTKLLLAVAFDQPWEPYIRRIWRDTGPFLDTILCNCVDYQQYASSNGFEAFCAWVRKTQVAADFFYTADNLSVDDRSYLALTEQRHREGPARNSDRDVSRMRLPDIELAAAQERAQDPEQTMFTGLRALGVLYRLNDYYPATAGSDDHRYFHHAARRLLHGFDTAQLPAQLRKAFKPELAWYEQRVRPQRRPRPRRPPRAGEIQGGILQPYHKVSHGVMLLVRIRDASAAGRFIAALPITRNGKEPDDDSPCYNIGFTANGLIQLQIDPDDLADLPQEFREGMAARAGMLGDVRCNHPSNWPLPNRLDSAEGADTSQVRRVQVSSVDFVLQLRCARPDLSYLADWTPAHPLFDAVAALEDLPGRDGVHLLALEVMGHQRNSKGQIREHFGFVDGISQPEITAQPSPDTRQWSNTAALGDVLLGYANSYGDPPFPTSRRDSFLDKGTFLVVRKLQQNHRALDARLPRNTSARARVMAKMMGRTFGGIPLARSTGSNGFDFSDDPLGDRCPLHAHIRRANPREVRPVIGEDRGGTIHVPRIMRRGMSYGPRYTPSTVDCNRGLIFMAYNASIAEQYEVVHRWLSGGNSSGGYSGQSDPFLGVPERGKARTFRYLEDGDVKRQPLQIPEQEEPIVRVQWGLYLFVPSMRALKQISRPVGRPKLIDRGVALIEQLRRIEAEQDLGFAPAPHEVSAFDRWKALLEDVHAAQREDLDALWAAVRAHHGGVLRTPYGVLVGSPELVREVFTDQGGRFSVRNYWWRLGQSFGDIYLSMDPEPRAFPGDDPTQPDGTCPYHEQVTPGDYATAAAPVNDIINAFSERWAFDPAYQAAQSYLASLTPGQQGNLRVRNLVEFVLGELAARWFGIPDGRHILRAGEPTLNKPDTLHCPFHFISSSRYAFSPHPGDAAIAEGQDHGDRLRIATEKWIREQLRKPPASPTPIGGPMIDLLGHDPARCASEIIGVMHGFLPSTLGNLLKAIMVWTDDGNLWRIQEDLLHAHAASAFDNARAAILDPLTRVMQYRPVPDQLHRLVVSEDVTLGKESLRSGEQIVLGLGSASAALLEAGKADATWVFGGPCSGRQATAHGCPGRKMAMGTMLGIVAALLDSGQLRAEPAPLILTLLGDPV